MKIFKIGMMALLGSVLFLQACQKDDDNNNTNTMSRTTFVMQASSANMLEIKAGAMAREKGSNADVKEYGEHMVNDHTEAGAQLKSIAQSKGITVSDQLMDKHQQMLNTLTPLSGDAFDRAFAALMVQSHKATIDLFTDAAAHVDDNDLKNFANSKLPTLREHLSEAEELNADVNE